jgi:AcrR family transcriptional regulator
MALTREQILLAAVELADRDGLPSLSMRSLARHVGVEAMSLYHHVANKEALLDGMVDVVFSEMHLPRSDRDWADEMRKRSTSGREALTRHRWAVGLMDSRSAPGADTLRHHDAVLGCLRAGGFPVRLAGHAFAVLDSYLYGFMVQELSLPLPSGTDIAGLADQILASMPADSLPHLAELTREVVLKPGYAFGDEFGFGLELVLDGLARRLADPVDA